jgi:hypothetical protein
LLEWWLATSTAISPEEVDRIFQTLVIPDIRAATSSVRHHQGSR